MAITDVSFYSGPEKKILTFQILSEIFTKVAVIYNNSLILSFMSYKASSFNCSSEKYSFSFTAKSLRSLKQTKKKEIRWLSPFPGHGPEGQFLDLRFGCLARRLVWVEAP